MPDLVTVLVAFTIGSALTYLLLRRRQPRSRIERFELTPPVMAPGKPGARNQEQPLTQIAEGLGSELADLATGVEGHAQLLCEAIGNPRLVASQAGRLWTSVRKLRLFSEKVISSRRTPVVRRTPTDVGPLLFSLRQELEDYSGAGLQVKCETATYLPLAMADRQALRKAILFLVDTLLDLETDAGVLVLQASNKVDDDLAPSLEIEIRVEGENSQLAPLDAMQRPALGSAAASNLIRCLGGQLTLEHCPGLCSTARIQLEAALPEATPAAEIQAPQPAPVQHPFGGILIVEDDPGVRAVVAREMEKTGRRIFCCADGAAARSLFAATPERFELLILDREARRQPGAKFATEALAQSPDLKILLLGSEPNSERAVSPSPGARCQQLHKPFGIIELREAVQQLLGPAVCSPV